MKPIATSSGWPLRLGSRLWRTVKHWVDRWRERPPHGPPVDIDNTSSGGGGGGGG